ncbi:MAG: DUF4082 domain-containing protein [Candidatus Nanopelagicales bacterium]
MSITPAGPQPLAHRRRPLEGSAANQPLITFSRQGARRRVFSRTLASSAALRLLAASALAAASTTGLAAVTSGAPVTSGYFAESDGPATSADAIDSDRSAVELGMKVTFASPGSVVGVRFFKGGNANAGTHTGSVWNTTGQRLRTATFTGETASGWQRVNFSTPLAVTAGQTLVVSYFAPQGGYSATTNYFSGVTTRSTLTALESAGVYKYGASGGFPAVVYQNSNYWVDPLFAPSSTVSSPTNPTPTPIPDSSGAFPSAATTGVPAGTSLSAYTGPSRITNAGTVIENKLITTPLVITSSANNVKIRNCRIAARGFWLVLNDEGATNLQITDSELDGLNNTNNDAAVAGRNYTLTRVNIHNTVDGLKLGSNVTVRDSFIHDLVVAGDSHNDGMQSLGAADVLIEHNTIISPRASTSAIILSTGSGAQHRITMRNNLLGGGAYTVYGGYQPGMDSLSRVSDIVITDNRITTSVYPNGGAYGPFTSVGSAAVTMRGNVWHDGPKAGQPA